MTVIKRLARELNDRLAEGVGSALSAPSSTMAQRRRVRGSESAFVSTGTGTAGQTTLSAPLSRRAMMIGASGLAAGAASAPFVLSATTVDAESTLEHAWPNIGRPLSSVEVERQRFIQTFLEQVEYKDSESDVDLIGEVVRLANLEPRATSAADGPDVPLPAVDPVTQRMPSPTIARLDTAPAPGQPGHGTAGLDLFARPQAPELANVTRAQDLPDGQHDALGLANEWQAGDNASPASQVSAGANRPSLFELEVNSPLSIASPTPDLPQNATAGAALSSGAGHELAAHPLSPNRESDAPRSELDRLLQSLIEDSEGELFVEGERPSPPMARADVDPAAMMAASRTQPTITATAPRPLAAMSAPMPDTQSQLAAPPAIRAASQSRIAAAGQAEAAPRLGTGLDRSVRIKNIHTGDYLTAKFVSNGFYDLGALSELQYVLRDRMDGSTRDMDPGLYDQMHSIIAMAGKSENTLVHLVSGYRSPSTNSILRARSNGVAKNSYHTRGQAADMFVDGVPLEQAHINALKLTAGGVGYYPGSNFIHVDTGPVRNWPAAYRSLGTRYRT